MKWILIVPAVFVFVGLVIAAVGAMLPREHQVSREARFGCSAAMLFAIVRDFAAYPAWREGVQGAEILPVSSDGLVGYREASRHGRITYRVIEERTAEKLVLQIADEDLPYGGTWTFAFVPDGSGARLQITERGFVKNPVFRFMARFVFGYSGSIEGYLRDLERKGEGLKGRKAEGLKE